MKQKEKKIVLEKIRLSNREKLNLISNLTTMIHAGISILSAVHSLRDEAQGNSRILLQTISDDLLQGKQLHESFMKFPKVFDTVTVHMIRAAEASGTLDTALLDVKDQIKKNIALQKKVRTAMTYPSMVVIVLIAIMTMILLVVIPKIATVFTQLKVTIPLPTKLLIAASFGLIHYPLIVLAGVIALAVGGFFLGRAQYPRLIRAISRLPVVAGIVKNIDLWRFSRSMHLLLSSGMTITSSLELTEKIMVKPEIARAIAFTHQQVLTGQPISASFKAHPKIFHTNMVELILAGEKTGSLDQSLRHIAEYLDDEINEGIERLMTLMEPVLLVIVAVLVGAMMLAIIGPIYGMIGSIAPNL